MKNSFEQAYKKLNKKQKKAVDTIDGPVLVIAGPGTGKTQILATRIAKILLETDIQASNILALTYTNAAVVAMQERLKKFIGAEAYKLSIFTFHSFGTKILQENEHLMRERNLQPISELEKVQLGNYIIDQLAPNNVLRRLSGDMYYDREHIFSVIDFMKKEKWVPDKILKTVENGIREIHDDQGNDFHYKRKSKEFEAGDLKPNKWKPFIQNMEKLKAAIQLFDPLQEKLREKKLFDYPDMLLKSIELLQKNPDILANYQEQYQYILVDEFQDTSGAQSELLYLLASYWKNNPNLFVVGDDDQSIYKFQGANIENVKNFYDRYQPNLTKIFLKQNYRSTQNVLDASKILIDHNHERLNKYLGIEKILQSNNPKQNQKVQISSYSNPYYEALDTVKKIKGLISNGTKPEEIAVIYAKHKFGNHIEIALQNENIPLQKAKKSNALVNNWVSKWLKILRYIDMEINRPFSADHLLFEILHYPQFGISPLSLAQLGFYFKQNPTAKIWRQDIQNVEAGNDMLKETKISKEQRAKIKSTVADLEYLMGKYFQVSPIELAELALKKLNFLQIALQGESRKENLECINAFFKFIQFEAKKKTITALSEIITNIDLMLENKISLAVEIFQGSTKGVNMLSAHGSKGLEFEHVFIINASSQWEKKSPYDGLPYQMAKVLPNMDILDGNIEEKRRLFFVAMTRAKFGLHISYPKTNDGKGMVPSQFVAELENTDFVELHNQQNNEYQMEDLVQLIFKEKDLIMENLLNKEMIQKSLEGYKLSVTHLNTFLKCPRTFYYQHVLRIPQAKNQYMAFGTAMHFALDSSFKAMLAHPKKEMPTVDFAIQQYNFSIKNQGDSLNEKILASLLLRGEEQLKALFTRRKAQWEMNTNFSTEKKIEGVVVRGVPIKGQLDKLIFSQNMVDVVDFKTGKYSNKKKSIAPPQKEALPSEGEKYYGGDYWRQVVFYKILVDSSSSIQHTFQRGIISYVQEEKGKFHEIVMEPSQEEVEIVSTQIEESYAAIKNGEFNKSCAEEKCYWCNFQKQLAMNKIDIDM